MWGRIKFEKYVQKKCWDETAWIKQEMKVSKKIRDEIAWIRNGACSSKFLWLHRIPAEHFLFIKTQLTTSTYKTSATSDSAYSAMSVEDVCELGSLLQSGDKEKEMLERKLLELDGGIQNQDRRVRDVLSHFISKTSRHWPKDRKSVV